MKSRKNKPDSGNILVSQQGHSFACSCYEGGINVTDLSPIYRIAGLGILVAVLNIFLVQAERKEQAQMLSLAGVIIVLLWLVQMVGQLFSDVEAVFRW